jgi:hypothetical protein
VWVLGTLAKRWTAVLQPEGFDSPILRTIRPTRSKIEVDLAVCVLTRVWAWHSLEVLGKRVRYSGARVRWKPRFMRGFCFLSELADGSVRAIPFATNTAVELGSTGQPGRLSSAERR